MSITGSLRQISAYLLERVKQTPSSLNVFLRVSPVDDELKIEYIQGFSSDRLAMLHEISVNLEQVVNQWTLQDITWLEYWKQEYSADYERLRSDVYRLVTEGKTTSSIDLFQDWHLLSYIFRNDPSMDFQPFLVTEEGEDLRVNVVLCGQPIGEGIRYLEIQEVQTIAEGLSRISEATILHRIQHGETFRSKLYSVWAEEDYEELLEFCRDVKEFYSDAENRGNAMLIEIV